MQILNEEQLLDPAIRRSVLKDIESANNRQRKAESFKRYECYKDKTSSYVMELLLRQFDADTVYEMQYAMTNISMLRKIISKLAKVYQNGAIRTTEQESLNQEIQKAAQYLSINRQMKKANAHFKLQKNIALYVKPIQKDGVYDLELCPLDPHLYDVIPYPNDEHSAMACIISDYYPDRASLYATDPATALRTSYPNVRSISHDQQSRNPNSAIAESGPLDSNDEAKKKRYVWWSKNYHFTTDGLGEIIVNVDTEFSVANPIGKLPVVFMSEDPDASFYSEGGNDLADSAIKINALLSNVNHIAITQGYGQPVFTGKAAPKSLKIGPNKCLILEYNKDEDPKPEFNFITANPPISDLIKTVEMYIALVLTTNNLSTSSVKSQLTGSSDFASGIALLIDKAESIEDTEEQTEYFRRAEPEVWALFFAWLDMLKRSGVQLNDKISTMDFPVDTEVMVSFNAQQVIMSELDKLTVIEKRKDLGINTMVELIQRDNPSITEEEAKKKLEQIMQEKMERMNEAAGLMEENEDGMANNMEAKEETENEEEPKEELDTDEQD